MEGNNKAMREALKQALYFLRRHHMGAVYATDGETLIFCDDVANIVNNALSAPPRNCDAGTAGEQAKRLSEWCSGRHCVNCQFKGGWPDECKLRWAQMPYEEGGEK